MTYRIGLHDWLNNHKLEYRVQASTREQAIQAALKQAGSTYNYVWSEITYLKPEITA